MGRRTLIVLDTHAWLWWVDDPARLSPEARRAIEGADEIGVSAMSAFELAGLVRRGRIRLDREVAAWVRSALARDRARALPVTSEIAVAAGELREPFPGDPADRLIYASARASGAILVTRDRALRGFDRQGTLW